VRLGSYLERVNPFFPQHFWQFDGTITRKGLGCELAGIQPSLVNEPHATSEYRITIRERWPMYGFLEKRRWCSHENAVDSVAHLNARIFHLKSSAKAKIFGAFDIAEQRSLKTITWSRNSAKLSKVSNKLFSFEVVGNYFENAASRLIYCSFVLKVCQRWWHRDDKCK